MRGPFALFLAHLIMVASPSFGEALPKLDTHQKQVMIIELEMQKMAMVWESVGHLGENDPIPFDLAQQLLNSHEKIEATITEIEAIQIQIDAEILIWATACEGEDACHDAYSQLEIYSGLRTITALLVEEAKGAILTDKFILATDAQMGDTY